VSDITISAILPNYNDEATVGEAIVAILAQSHKVHELIVIDDGSTDNSLDVIAPLVRRFPVITLLRNPVNRGLLQACNRAFKAASGDYIYPASANDMALPGLFAQCASILSRYPEAGLCHVDIVAPDGHVNAMRLSRAPAYFSPDELQIVFRQAGGITAGGGNSLIRRSAFARAGYYIEDLEWNSDIFATTVVCAREGACYVPEPLVRIGVDTQSYSAKGRRRLGAQQAIFTRMLSLLKSDGYRDVFDWIRQSGVWPMLDWSMIPAFALDRELRAFVSARLFTEVLYCGMRARFGSRLPLAIKRWIRGRRIGAATASSTSPNHTSLSRQ
jgi:glycosyltransferase involved in cell wall biosynthesis